MASDRQTAANRENARRSTGPRTPLGKARASLNAVRHGLSARNAVLPDAAALMSTPQTCLMALFCPKAHPNVPKSDSYAMELGPPPDWAMPSVAGRLDG
jgi:hypothetical protein